MLESMNLTQARSDTARLPSIFVPHGAPTFALRPGAAGAAMAGYARQFPAPRAIIVVSAHWTTRTPEVGAAARPKTIHDYWGFPAELYSLSYPATGCKEASREVARALENAKFPVNLQDDQGLDHGAWIPLRLMYPDADIPVIPLSIQAHEGPEYHWNLGRSLAGLADRGFLILASGALTHNLQDYIRIRGGNSIDLGYVRAFADWFWDRLSVGASADLFDYRRLAPGATRAHPQDDHLLPFFVAMGAGQSEGRVPVRPHHGVDDYVLAMDMFAFEPQEID